MQNISKLTYETVDELSARDCRGYFVAFPVHIQQLVLVSVCIDQ